MSPKTALVNQFPPFYLNVYVQVKLKYNIVILCK